MTEFDVVLIGTGQATATMVPAFLERGLSVAVAEHDRAGGTCVNWGCTPTKTLVASARAAHMVRRAGDFGVNVPHFQVDFSRVMERQNAIRSANSEAFEAWLREKTHFRAVSARFTDEHHVALGEEVVRAERVYIHTGAHARIPAIPGLDEVPYLDNKGILALTELPEHLIVVGGSYIGLEFGQIFRRLGSDVTVLERGSRIMKREDEDVAEEATRVLEDEGVRIVCGAGVERVERASEGVAVHLSVNDDERTITGSHLLLATGREPETASLNLAAAGVRTDERGFIPTDEYLRTNVPHIYAVGDVNGRSAFTHTSVHDGQVIVSNLDGPGLRRSDREPIYSMFIDPPLGRVGMNEAQARASGRRILQGTMPMSEISRAKEKAETAGLVKVLVDAESGGLVGATVFGTGGDEVIALLAAWIYTRLPYTELQKVVLVHPTVAELMPFVFNNLTPLE